MIICMNYGTDGERYIARIDYLNVRDRVTLNDLTKYFKKKYDEVYIIDFKENETFIDEVVLRGCRV